MSTVLFINNEAQCIEDLIMNYGCLVKKIFVGVYTIDSIDSIIKINNSRKNALVEIDRLQALHNVKGVPKLLATNPNSTSEFYYIIMTKAKGMDLYEYTQKFGVFTEDNFKPIAINILKTLKKIHKLNIIHRDIKPENIMYDNETEKITIVDFEGRFTKSYASPEQLRNKRVTLKSDMWSFGVTCYNSVSRVSLFKNKNDVLNKIVTYPDSFSELFRDFLECIIQYNPSSRYSAKEALNHPWFF